MELCNLVSIQHYTKAMSNLQRAALVEKFRQKPRERMDVLTEALKASNYDDDEPFLGSAGVSIRREFTCVKGRVSQTPKLKVGNGDEIYLRNGRWNFNNKILIEPTKLKRWALVNFSARRDIHSLARDLSRCG